MAIEQKIPSPSEINKSSQKFSTKEIEEIKKLRTELNQIIVELGQLYINKINNKKQKTKDKNIIS